MQKKSIIKNRLTYFNFFKMNLLGPFTHKLENVAMKSGPCLKCIFSKYNGSSGTVLNPSPKSPVASGFLNFSTSSEMHFSGFAKFREHGVIDDAGEMIQIKKTKMNKKLNIPVRSRHLEILREHINYSAPWKLPNLLISKQ